MYMHSAISHHSLEVWVMMTRFIVRVRNSFSIARDNDDDDDDGFIISSPALQSAENVYILSHQKKHRQQQ